MSDTLVPLDPQSAGPDDSGPRSGRSRIAPFIALALAVIVGALFVVLAGSDPATDDTIDTSLENQAAPVAQSTTLDGQAFDLSRRKGSWVVLNFFDPTCVPCVNEHPQLVTFAQQQRELVDGAELYTIIDMVLSDGSDQSVRDFFAQNGGDWPVVSDPDGSISVAFGVAKVPETWIIDPDGIIRKRFGGEITADGLAAWVQRLRELRG